MVTCPGIGVLVCGPLAGEHGIGLEKKPDQHVGRNGKEIAPMRKRKTALDPKSIL
ncbi:MAG: hypothetical protein K9G30_01425 [Parvibaculum sp.]|nr:hypothetical protein [Parvibaculum sp.]